MSEKDLIVLLWGEEAGRVTCDRSGRLRFAYAESWRRRPDAVPLSLSMPLAAVDHGDKVVSAYLWGLLPENEVVLDRWAKKFQVSARNAFALIANVGEDCAGAAQFVRSERVEAVAGDGPSDVEWLDEKGVAARLRALREDQGAWRSPSDSGQFSLAGAQPKTALLFDGKRFGVPAGRTPTTHILKPPLRDFPGHVENEHLCLALARDVGLAAASSEVRRFEEELALVVTRYDRARTRDLEAADESAVEGAVRRSGGGRQPMARLHQEDLCQALGLPPTGKYQSERGPSPRQVIGLLRDFSSEPHKDVLAFVDALAFNWLIGGTDAHAKNYSLLHAAGGQVRLAPLHDVATALIYPKLDPKRLRMAMKIGSTYLLRDVVGRHWRDLASQVGLDADETADRLARTAEDISERLPGVGRRAIEEGLEASVVGRFVELLSDHARRCRRALAAGAKE